MNKALPRSMKDFRLETRHVAYEAARRQRKSLDEWLHGVMADYAADLGLDEYELGSRQRVDAVAARLERLSARDGDEDLSSIDPLSMDERVMDRRAFSSRAADRNDDDHREDFHSEDTELILEDAIEAMRRRLPRGEVSTGSARYPFAERPGRQASGRESARTYAPRSHSFETRDTDDFRPSEVSRARQGDMTDARSPPRPPEATYWKFGDKLNAILDNLQTQPASGAPPVTAPVPDRRLGAAIADVRKRQRVLDQAGRTPPAPVDDVSRDTAMRIENRFSAVFDALRKKIATQETTIDGLRRDVVGQRDARLKLAGDLTTLCAEISDTLRNLRSRGGEAAAETFAKTSLDAALTMPKAANPTSTMAPDPGSNAGPQAIVELQNQELQNQELQNQVGAKHFERSKDSLAKLASIERSVRELFTHQAAMRSLQGEAEARTTLTFNAVHEALGKIVERLSLMDKVMAEVRDRPPSIPSKAPIPSDTSGPSQLSGRRAGEGAGVRSDLARDVAKAFSEKALAPPTVGVAAQKGAPTRPPWRERPVVVEVAPPGPKRFAALGRSRAYLARQAKPALAASAALLIAAGTAAAVYSVGFMGHDHEIDARLASPRIAGAADLLPGRLQRVERQEPQGDASSFTAADPVQAEANAGFPSFIAKSMPREMPARLVRLKALAEAGNGAAQYELGVEYCETDVMPRDFARAAQWFQKAAGQGIAPAQYRLAALYEKGLGVPHDTNFAKALYLKAAEAGHPRAMHNLAVLLVDGNGKPDYEGASRWFRKAAQFGVHDSQYNLGILLGGGVGLPQSLVQSYAWFTIAAAHNDADAAKKRDEVGLKLSAGDIAAARALAASFRARAPDLAAIQVQLPPGEETAVAKLVP